VSHDVDIGRRSKTSGDASISTDMSRHSCSFATMTRRRIDSHLRDVRAAR
jgi:hypothetical protein